MLNGIEGNETEVSIENRKRFRVFRWVWARRTGIGAIFAILLSTGDWIDRRLIVSHNIALEEEAAARERQSHSPSVTFENLQYDFVINESGVLQPFGAEASNPVIVSTCQQSIAELHVEWKPIPFDRIWPTASVGDFMRNIESPVRNNVFPENGSTGMIARMPEWIAKTEANPMGWKGLGKNVKGLIYGTLFVSGIAKDGQRLRQEFMFKVKAIDEGNRTIFRLKIEEPIKPNSLVKNPMESLVKMSDRFFRNDPGAFDDVDSMPLTPEMLKEMDY